MMPDCAPPLTFETCGTIPTVSEALLDEFAKAKIMGDDVQGVVSMPKKKRRKRTKKGNTAGVTKSKNSNKGTVESANSQGNQNVLCISRNKHWKYISSYHGPWLQLPLELLESLLILNLDPATVSSEHSPISPPSSPSPSSTSSRRVGFARLLDRTSSLISNTTSLQRSAGLGVSTTALASSSPKLSPALIPPPGKATPPPIDPGVFRSVTTIRRLIDEAAELAVRASSGLSAAALGSLQGGGGGGSGGGAFGLNGSSWAAAQALGLNSLGEFGGGGGGRNVPMSATRIHRLRALAVQKLAEAYRTDEIASSVMVMQRGTVFDDIAERVLKIDPKNVDARYVHFFHEKIPSRQLAESTSTSVLDQLLAENPQRIEFYRTRAIVHCFRDEYPLAVRDFSQALKESRAIRKTRQAHKPSQRANSENGLSKAKRRKGKVNGQAPPDGTAAVIEGADGEQLLLHPSVLPDAPEPIELQALFLRGSAYFAHALYLIEDAFFKLEEIPRVPLNDFGEMQLCYVRGKYGGTEVNNPDGPLGRSDGAKARAYRAVLGESPLREQVCALLRKSKRDHERFLAHFDSMEPSAEAFDGVEQLTDTLQKMERAFALLDAYRPMSRQHESSSNSAQELTDIPLTFTTYHPLMLEAHFSILNCLLMLGDFETLTSTFERTSGIVAGLEGYPVFLPPRSMAQGEFMETLERLAGGWKYGKMSNALVRVQKQPMRPPSATHPSRDLIFADDEAATGTSSSSAGPSTSASSSTNPSPSSGRRPSLSEDADIDSPAPASTDTQSDLRTTLEHLRFLLAPMHNRLRKRAERAANEKARGEEGKKSAPLSLALHSARVEVILAWLGAVHLPELQEVAE
ncbi:hypothetical protein ACEPAF_4160 [Sanghuangporus sanghuang]